MVKYRDYTVNKDFTIEAGTEHEYKGKKYKRSYMGGAAFDHEVKPFEDCEHGGKVWKLYRTNRREYYRRYGRV